MGEITVTDNSNRDHSNKSITGKIIFFAIIVILIGIFLSLLFSIFFFGFAGIFTLLGVHYDSIWTLILFVITYFIVGFIVEIFFDGLRKFAVQYTNESVESFIIQILISFVGNYFVISLLEFIITGISFAFTTKIVIVLLLAILDVVFDNKKKN